MENNMKFKVWDKYDKKFINSENYFINSKGTLYEYSRNTFYSDACLNFIPVYSTEKTDKNGVELFKGDKVKRPGGDPTVVEIIFKNGCWCVLNRELRAYYTMFDFFIQLRNGKGYQCEKIGTTFENPELLP